MLSTTENIRVRFVTKHAEYAVSDAPFAVPLNLGRTGLSEVVNHLLEKEHPIPFDFIIKGVLLRQSLKKYIAANHISTENILIIEYIPALYFSDDKQSMDMSSWIGCIDTSHYNDKTDVNVPPMVTVATYDGQMQFISPTTMTVQSSYQAHDDPIRAIAYHQNLLITASKDQSIKIWSNLSHQPEFIALLKGHLNSVEALTVWPEKSLVLSGDWNGNLIGWNISSLLERKVAGEDTDVKKSKKKLRSNEGKSVALKSSVIDDVKPLFVLKAHVQSISGIQSVDHDIVYSSSWDHSLKKWDMERQDCVATYATSKVMTSLHASIDGDLVLTSHADGKIRLWDTRTQSDAQCKNVFGTQDANNSQWISQVRWHPTSEYLYASSDYAGIVRVWDIRASIPIGITEQHDGKSLCIDWLISRNDNTENHVHVLSGGSDCCLKSIELI